MLDARTTNAIHSSAVVDMERVRVGTDVIIGAGAILTTHITVGNHVYIGPGCTISYGAALEDFVTLGPGVHVGAGARIKEAALVGAGSVIEGGASLASGLKGVQQARTMADLFTQTSGGETLVDLMSLELIIGSGGILSHAPRRQQAALMLIDAFEPQGVTKLAVDSIFMMPQLGVLAQELPEAAPERPTLKPCRGSASSRPSRSRIFNPRLLVSGETRCSAPNCLTEGRN